MGVKSAERVLEIFELLKDYPNGLTAKEIGVELGYAASSNFELIKTLSQSDYLLEDENKRYTLGPKLIQLGTYAASYLDLNKIARPILNRLMNSLKETVFMAILSGDEIVYVAKFDSYRSISTNARLGGHKPIYCTGLGKALLAFMPEQDQNRILERIQLERFTPNTITDKKVLIQQLKQFKEQGYAIDNEEIEVGLWCASAPIFNSQKNLEAAISISGPTSRMLTNKDEVVKQILEAASELSSKLGYSD